MALSVRESNHHGHVTNSAVALNSESTAKLVRFVIENDVAGLSNFLDALVKGYSHNNSNRPKYYLGDVLNSPDGNGWRPLHHAFHLRRYDCAKLLIEAGENRSVADFVYGTCDDAAARIITFVAASMIVYRCDNGRFWVSAS